VLHKDPLLVAHPGETGFEAIKRAAGSAGVLVVSDGAGGIVITRNGSARASALILGFNVLTYDVKYDGKDRYYRYQVASQVPGTDEASGDATRILAEAFDLGVKRTDRVLVIRPDKGLNVAEAKRHADWQARVRAARAQTLVVSVQGWTQPNSDVLWPLNAIALVVIPRARINGDMLISQVEYTIGQGARVTQLHLVRPDAFEPEPQAAAVSAQTPWLISAGSPGEFKEPK
jgi:prophage tail gpP-like protein